jgi:hypothetical protein
VQVKPVHDDQVSVADTLISARKRELPDRRRTPILLGSALYG